MADWSLTSRNALFELGVSCPFAACVLFFFFFFLLNGSSQNLPQNEIQRCSNEFYFNTQVEIHEYFTKKYIWPTGS